MKTNMLDFILNIIFPSRCVACGEHGSDLCAKCLKDAPAAERECANWIFPLLDYRYPPVKKSIWFLKYKNRKKLAGIFAAIMHGRIMEELSDLSRLKNFRNPVLIPIPLSQERYKERGYNQAELICRELVKINGKNNSPPENNIFTETFAENFKMNKDILVKTKETKHQTDMKNRQDRLRNLHGSFAVKNPQNLKGRNVVLIDDIVTTGATLTEAKRTLKHSGAGKIIAFTVAH